MSNHVCQWILLIALCSVSGCDRPSQLNQTTAPPAAPAQVAKRPTISDTTEPVQPPSQTDESPSAPAEDAAPAQPAAEEAVTRPAPAAASAPSIDANAKLPKVLLTQAHAESCLIKVGQRLPAMDLQDLQGQPVNTAKLLGQRLTVIVFWSSSNRYAEEELADLKFDVAQRYSGTGVKVIAINVNDPVDQARQVITRVKATYPILFDQGGRALAQVARGHLPRTYLVAADGRVIWFDLEYSRSTRRELQQAIQASLAGRI